MRSLLQNLAWFVGLVLLQVLVLSHVHIGGYATPFFFIYFILRYNSSVGRNVLLFWAFSLVLVIDIFSNTPGVNTAAITLVAFVREPIIRLVTWKEMEEDFAPGVVAMGFSSYFSYVFLCTFIFCCVVELIEAFSFFHWQEMVWRILADMAITLICIFCAESIRRKK